MAGGTAADASAVLCAWAAALADVADEPGTEIQALVWGPRFDREHALALLARLPRADAGWLAAIHAFADRFDALAPAEQQALRRGIRRMAENAPCRESC